MRKQGSNRKNWNQRWFRLSSAALSYYKDSKASKSLGIMVLAEAAVHASSRKPFGFFVATPDRVLNIWPNSQQDRDEWMTAIRGVIRVPLGGVGEKMEEDEITAKIQEKRTKTAKDDQEGASSSGSASSDSDDELLNISGGVSVTTSAVSLTTGGVVAKEGNLMKKGQKRRNWKRRWFVLQSDGLYYYESQEMKDLKGGIQFTMGAVTIVNDNSRACAFFVQLGQRRLFIQAASTEEQEDWMKAISQQANAYRTF